jgi:hypothetical protein
MGLQYEIQYHKRSENKVVDALSRHPELQKDRNCCAVIEVMPSWLQELQVSYQGDEWASNILSNSPSLSPNKEKISVHKGIIRRKGKIYVGVMAD